MRYRKMPTSERVAWSGGFFFAVGMLVALAIAIEKGYENLRLQEQLDIARDAHVQHVIDITKCRDDVGKLMKANTEKELQRVFE